MHKTQSLVAALAISSLTLAACSSDSGESSADSNVELTLWMVTLEDSQKASIESMIDGFEAANEGITVTLEERATDSHKDALRQVAGTDAGPDIYWYWMGSGLAGELIDADMSADLTTYYEQYGWEDRFTTAAMDSVTQYGGYQGVPFTSQSQGIYYNKELFAQAGITEEPTTYEELIEAANKLEAAGITAITMGGTDNWHIMRLLDQLVETECGTETADELNTGDGDWSAEECVTSAFTELKYWGDNYFNEDYAAISRDDAVQQFYSGQAAMALEGTWFSAQATDNGMDPENIGIFAFPTGTGRLYGFSEGFYISESSDQKDAAAKFLDYITSTEVQESALGVWAASSVNSEVTPSSEDVLATLWAEIESEASGSFMNNDQNFAAAEASEYWRIQNSVLTGEIDPVNAGVEFQEWRDANS